MAKIKLNEWLNAIAEVKKQKADVIPKGWISSQEFADKIGCHLTTAEHKLHDLYHLQLADRERYRVSHGGTLTSRYYYRLRKPDARNKKLRNIK